MHDDLLANRPEGASHNADICPFCVDKATEAESTTSRIPPADGGPDVTEKSETTSTEGGTPTPMNDMISQETHKALLAQAVSEAVKSTEAALETANAKVSELSGKVEKLEADNAGLKADNDRINGELDSAQVSLKTATDKVATLEADIAKKEDDARKAEIASERAKQVKNLKLYDDEYVAERASDWAELSDEDWASRLDEWKKLKPADAANDQNSDTASSALSGTSEEGLTKEPKTDAASETTPSPRRSVLGLV